MAGIYLRLLEHIAAAPAAALRQRQSLPGRQKAMVAATALAGIWDRVPGARPPGPDRSAPGRQAVSGSAPAGPAEGRP